MSEELLYTVVIIEDWTVHPLFNFIKYNELDVFYLKSAYFVSRTEEICSLQINRGPVPAPLKMLQIRVVYEIK